MSSVWTRAWEKTPKIDCGLCGYVRCACFARAALVGDCKSDLCPVLSVPEFSRQSAELESLLSRGAQGFPKPAPEMPKGGVLLTSPCKDRVDRVMAELRVYNGVKEGEPARFMVFDSTVLCDMLECLSSQFEILKCSRDLGYARADTGETSVTLLQDGRINMRRMNDIDHVKRLFAMIESAVMPSVVCNCCAMDLLSILADGAKDVEHKHTIFKAGSTVSLNVEQLSGTSSRDAMLSYGGEFFAEVVRNLDGMFDWLRLEVEKILTKAPSKAGNRPDTKSVRSMLVALAHDDQIKGRESLVYKAQAILWLIENGLRGLAQLQRELEQKSGAELNELRRLLLSASNGVLPDYERNVVKSGLLLSYAQMRRVDRAMKAFSSWTTKRENQ